MTDDLTALRALAENATEYRNIDGTPNEMARWFAGHHDGDGKPFADGFSYVGGGFDGEIIAERMTAADAEFIAAFDPFAVVALLDRLERAEAELAESRSMTREEYQRFYVESGRNAAVKKARNDSTRASAVNHRTPWTREELDLALRTDIPASEVAKTLGRTEYAINHKRRNRAALDTGKETG